MKAIYIGDEFPGYYEYECEVRRPEEEWQGDYEIRFLGEEDWTDNIYEEELRFL